MAKNEKGQSLVESVIALLAICGLVGGLWSFFIMAWTKLWLVYSAEQALTCMLQTRSRLECEKAIEKRLALLLPWKKHPQVQVACNRRSCRAQAENEVRRRVIP